MFHKAVVYKKSGDGAPAQRPWHCECSCGPAGDFDSEAQARAYIANHFAKLTGVFTTELLEGDPKLAKKAAAPAPAAMPKAQPVAKPALSPAQLDAKKKAEELVKKAGKKVGA